MEVLMVISQLENIIVMVEEVGEVGEDEVEEQEVEEDEIEEVGEFF